MASPNRYRVRPHINEPLLILFIFTKEQVIPLFAAVAIGMVTKQTLLFVGMAIIYMYITQKLKDRIPRSYLRHKTWSTGLAPTPPSKSVVDPIKKEYFR